MQKPKAKSQNCSSKFKTSKTLEKAVDFHGHLGPYLVLGMLMGNLAINRLKSKRHFGIKAIIKGATQKPKSCLIDGIQVSTGCTYGKGNILKSRGDEIEVLFQNLRNNKKIKICLHKDLLKRLDALNGHKESEAFARELYKTDPLKVFNLTTNH